MQDAEVARARPNLADRRILKATYAALGLSYAVYLYLYFYRCLFEATVDLPTFYAAAHHVFRQGTSPYDHVALSEWMGRDVFPFLYPPPSLLLFYPLSPFDFPTARALVLVLNHAAIVTVAGLLAALVRQHTLISRPWSWVVGAVAVLGFYPVVLTLQSGQTNLVIAVCLMVFWHFEKRGSRTVPGLCLALAISFKSYFVLLWLPLLLMRRLRPVLLSAALVAASAVVAWAVLPATVWADFYEKVARHGGYGEFPPGLFSPAGIWNQGLNGLFTRLFSVNEWTTPLVDDPALGVLLTQVVAGIASALTVFAWWSERDDEDMAFDRSLSAGLLLIFLVAPFSWEHHLTYLLPTGVLLCLPGMGSRPHRALRLAALVLLASPGVVRWKFYGVLALWLSVLSDMSMGEGVARLSMLVRSAVRRSGDS